MIRAKLRGRLGNQLFQYAICRIVAEQNGYDYSIPKEWQGQRLFECSLGVDCTHEENLNIFKEGKNKFNPEVFDVKDNTIIEGFWQSDKYLSGYEEQVKEWFRPSKIKPIKMKDNTCVIHLRMKDRYNRDLKLPKEYFDKAKEIVTSKVGQSIKFLIVTDNPNGAKNYFKDDKIISGTLTEDFITIHQAKYKIISASTFSWWASWLNTTEDSLIIAPNKWMDYNRPNSKLFFPIDIKTDKFTYI